MPRARDPLLRTCRYLHLLHVVRYLGSYGDMAFEKFVEIDRGEGREGKEGAGAVEYVVCSR